VRAVGGKVDLHIFGGLPHGFGNHVEFRPMMMTMIGGFFRRTVAEPEAFVSDRHAPTGGCTGGRRPGRIDPHAGVLSPP